MKSNKLSEAQTISMLNEAEASVPVNEVCRKYKVAYSTYYKLKSKYAGKSLSELKRLKTLERENWRLKSMYADLSLDHQILQEVVEKKFPEILDDDL